MRKLDSLAQRLCTVDPDIVEIVQFGSSVYAPRLAADVDLMVTTRVKKRDDLYFDAVMNWDQAVDVLVRESGQRMSQQMALAMLAFGRTVYGDGLTRREAKEFGDVATYELAHVYLTMAAENAQQAHREMGARIRDAYWRLSFDLLFDAARYAVMTFLATDETRWGRLAGKLPAPLEKQFRDFISVLHVQYAYDDLFPRDKADEQFAEWRAKVSAFVQELETESAPGQITVAG